MFIQSFEKTAAGIPEMVGKTIGTGKRVGRELRTGFRNWRKDVAQRTTTSMRAASQPGRKSPGEALATKRISQQATSTNKPVQLGETKAITQKAKQDVKDRAGRMADSRVKNKPSFAQKHPYLTAGGAFLAGRYALSGGQDGSQAQQPQISYPQQGY